MTAVRTRSAGVTFRHAEPVMGTVVSFDVRPQGLAYRRSHEAIGEACRLLHDADDVFSLYRPDTPLARLRRGELSLADCPGPVAEVRELCRLTRELTGGWFDPWAMPGGFDPTGLVKGWAAERAARHLQVAGIGAGMVNAAGDISLFGAPEAGEPWRIAVRSPQAPDRMLCAVEATGAVATSGAYERGEHILDPRTGRPAGGAVSATVCGPRLAIADALATGLIAAGDAGLGELAGSGYQALVVRADLTVAHTDGFPFVR